MEQQVYKILIAAYDLGIRKSLKNILKSMKYPFEIIDTSTGKAALDAIENNRFDLILLDTELPDQNSFDFLTELNCAGCEDLSVLLMTTAKDAGDRWKGLKLRSVDFIKKPIDAEDVKINVGLQIKIKKTLETVARLGKELEEKNKKLQEWDRLNARMGDNLSHQLRTPLTVIRESISQIADGLLGDVNESQKAYLEKSLINIDRLTNTINDLFDTTQNKKSKK